MASSSLSSLNTLANENIGHPVHKNSNSSNPLRPNQVHHSSSNSVISSSGEDSTTTTESSSEPGTSRGCSSSSNYDSGAFSRSSSPTIENGVMNLNNVSLSMSRLALTEPLVAPRLVLAATRGEWPNNEMPILTAEEVKEVEKIKSKHQRLHQLQQAAHRKKARARSMSAVRNDAEEEQITVSVGANTMLTIGSPAAQSTSDNNSSRLSNLRRSRSGLPVLGTTALRPSPVKPMRSSMTASNIRTKISTVYLAEAPADSSKLQANPVESTAKSSCSTAAVINRSSSIVTVMGSKPSGIKCDCTERVTVNGQHHCSKHITIRDLNKNQCSSEKQQGHGSTYVAANSIITTTAQVNVLSSSSMLEPQIKQTNKVVDRSTNTTPINVLNNNNNQMDNPSKYQQQKQPSSIIEI